MANDGLCSALQTNIDALQEVVDETRAGECDVEGLWREVDRICQKIAYLSEGVASGGEDDDEDGEQDDDGDLGDELDFDDEEDDEGGDYDEEEE